MYFDNDLPMNREMNEDMKDVYRMRFEGATYTAFEARWSMLLINELVLDVQMGFEDTTLMCRVTRRFWGRYGYMVSCSFDMHGFALWKTRTERVFAGDDAAFKGGEFAEVLVPYVIPFLTVKIRIIMDAHHRELIIPLLPNGKQDHSIRVAYCPRGGLRANSKRLETECGAMLADWRRYETLRRLHDEVALSSAHVMPYVEHMAATEQTRMNDESMAVEDLLHPSDVNQFGYVERKAMTLRKSVKAADAPAVSCVEVPQNHKLSSHQPIPRIQFDFKHEHDKFMNLVASTLQIPKRNVMMGEHTGLHGDNTTAIDEDMARAFRAVKDRRDELIEVLRDAYAVCHGKAGVEIHLPTTSQLKVDMLFLFHERGVFDDVVVKDELSALLGVNRDRFSKNKMT